ncbi:Quinol monooxygenase YgiN [Pseudooceanicola antarcticus]|uniref:Antibiotic biosynthesis monooxygenase n=1 Tax=Pseudooceanicola antarcticus TaxID=1247613 RepID=A0A285IHK8_9RHOB|nr:putative quinol monooxygenase [Pseudooceanicola antarcticus]PJE28977.1 antibiotic biosynthesis monooxygenase [Pseudooceanicola antarcticus]SNY47403.1 Quinol monooxygenase YgiN [Pseudooceanicola antarcticus]
MYIALVDFPHRDPVPLLPQVLAALPQVRAMAGCLDYRVLSDSEAPDRLILLHRWQDKPAFEGYLASEHFAALGALLRPGMTAPPVSLRLEAQEDILVTG